MPVILELRDTWLAPGWYQPEEFEATAKAFESSDWADIILHSCRHRWGHAPGDPRYAQDEVRLHPAPVLDMLTLVLHGAADGANHLKTSLGKEAMFRGLYECWLLAGVSHFPQREVPAEVLDVLLHFLKHPLLCQTRCGS